MHRKRRPWLWLVLVGAVIVNELRKPAGERTWHDRLFGVVPYDFRRPTFERFKDTLWNPADDRIVVPQAFGIGWSVNLGGLLKRVGLLG